MIKKLAFMAAASLLTISAGAAPLTPDEALARLRGNGPARVRSLNDGNMKLAYTATTAAGEAAAYLFYRDGQTGFAILSADDAAIPVLGYSDSESIDPANMPPALKWWLAKYAEQIQFGLAHGAKAYAPRQTPALAPIEPLCQTRWNQDAPFNNETPQINGKNCPTGCVATSMAQAMYYFKYPEMGQGNHSYRVDNKTYTINFERQPFDWDNMLTYYAEGDYNATQADAVSFLMKACGYSVDMNYRADQSGAQSLLVGNALVTYFKYDPNIKYLTRDQYSADQWMQICYDNLKNCGPIIYNGTDPIAGGHSFIVDGYDGNGYFHLNWGWGGMSDGYYTLDALSPMAQGLGGAIGGFNYDQDAVIGMQKPTGKPVEEQPLQLTQYGNINASISKTVSGSNVVFKTEGTTKPGWANMNIPTMDINVGAIFEPMSGGDKVEVVGKVGSSLTSAISLETYYMITNTTPPTVQIPANLANGEYKVTLATRLAEVDGAGFLPVKCSYGYSNYTILTVKDGEYSVRNVPASLLEFKSCELTSPLYYNRNTRIKAHVENPSDLQLSACITPQLVSGSTVAFTAETIYVTLDAGESKDVEWVCHFYPAKNTDFSSPTTYTLRILNQDSGKVYGKFGDVEMSSTTNGFTLKMNDYVVENASRSDMTVDGTEYKNVYQVANPEDFNVKFDYSCTRGYFDTAFVIGIYTRNAAGKYIPVTDYVYESQPFLPAGESESKTINVNFKGNDPSKVYYLRAMYIRSSAPVYMSQLLFHSDVNEVSDIMDDDSAAPVEFFNLMGVRIAEPQPGQLVIRRQGDRAEKIIFK